MAKSKLTNITITSPNCNARTQKVTKITIHHMAGNLSVEQCGNIFKSPSRQASSNYGIGSDGRIANYVDETKRAWTSGSEWNDQRAITIEVANDKVGEPWSISSKAYKSLIALCADICDRYGITPKYDGTKNASLTEHRMYQSTACPGTYIHKYLANHTIEKDIAKAMQSKKGWKKNSKGWWYDNGNGTYPKNQWQKISSKWYYFNAKGYMVTGWLKDKGYWYYLKSSGAMASSEWVKYKSNFYYLEASGKMATGSKTGLKATFDKDGKLTA